MPSPLIVETFPHSRVTSITLCPSAAIDGDFTRPSYVCGDTADYLDKPEHGNTHERASMLADALDRSNVIYLASPDPAFVYAITLLPIPSR